MKTLVRAGDGRRRGGALVFSVAAVLVVSILAAGFLQLCTMISRRLGTSSDTLQALNIAEAGLCEAYTGLALAHTGNVGSEAEPAFFGGGLMWVEATQHATGMVELECTAMYGTGRATLGIACQPVEVGVAGLGFFTLEDLRLNPDVRLDSYDSNQGSYASQVNTPLNNNGIVGSNGNVSIASGNLIFGDVVYGPTSKASVSAGSTVTGGMSPRAGEEVLPPIEVPPITLGKALKYTSATPMVVPPGEVGYNGLDIGKNTKLVLKGPLTIVVGDMKLGLGAQMVFDTTDGPIEMHVTNSIDLSTSSLVSTTTQVTADSVVLVSAPDGKSVNFGAKSQFYGFIYAPNAETHISAQYEVYGALICKELQLAAQGKMHYDLALGPTIDSLLPTLYSWRVVELPHPAAVNRRDPFQVLDLDPSSLPSPAYAHEDQVLDLRYEDLKGSNQTYFGLESEFDWSLVRTVLYGTRDGVAFLLSDDYYEAPVANDPLVDLVNSSMTSKQLRDALIAASPVSEEALTAACLRNPPMNESDLMNVLQKQGTLTEDVLLAAVASDSLDSGTLRNLLEDFSPLSSTVMNAVQSRSPSLSLSDLLALLGLQ